MGREVIGEMNRLGMVIDMSHSGIQSTLEAIEISDRPVAITHANPSSWHDVPRNKSDTVLKALAESGGMLGFSLYTHHLRNGERCTLTEFCEMVARTADLIGCDAIGIGSDLCQGQPDSVVTWMRNGAWTKAGQPARFPEQPPWFRSNLDLPKIGQALRAVGMSDCEVAKIMGGNWLEFYGKSFAGTSRSHPAGGTMALSPM
jgi:microsomal dipeptidase-like Zn-dependent dipeptidase